MFHISDQSRKIINVEKHISPNESRMQINYSNVWIVWIVNCFLHFYDCLKYDFLLRPRKKVKTANKSRKTERLSDFEIYQMLSRSFQSVAHSWLKYISRLLQSKRFMGFNWDSRQTNNTNREIPYMRTILKHKAHFSLSELDELRNSSSFHGWIQIEWTRLQI